MRRWRARARCSAASVLASCGMSVGPMARQRLLTCRHFVFADVFSCVASCAHEVAAHEHGDRGRRRAPAPARIALPRLGGQRVDEPPRRGEVGDQHEVVHVPDDDLEQFLPALAVGLDDEQVAEELNVERAQRRVADRRQPLRDALGRVVGDVLDLERLRARRSTARGCIPRTRTRGPSRQQQVLDVRPQRVEVGVCRRAPSSAAPRARGPATAFCRSGSRRERAERLGQASRAGALGRHRSRDEARNHRVGHPRRHLADDVRLRRCPGLAPSPSSCSITSGERRVAAWAMLSRIRSSVSGLAFDDVPRDALEDAQERRRAAAHVARGACAAPRDA